MAILKNKWVALALVLALSAGLFVAVVNFDNSARHEASTRSAGAQRHICSDLVRQGGPRTERDCEDDFFAAMRSAESSNFTTSMMIGAASVAGLWILLGLLYVFLRRKPEQGAVG